MNNSKVSIFLEQSQPEHSTTEPLDLKNKLYQQSIVQHILKSDWKDKGSSGPLVVELDPTTACNLSCPSCISRDLLNQGSFSREKLREIARDLVAAGVKAVVLIGGGEPLAHPDIDWVISYLGDNGIKLGLTTNGLLIDRHLDTIAKNMSWTRVSIDAGTPETFQVIRPHKSGVSQFQKAIYNMKKLAERKQGLLGFSFMLFSVGGFDPDQNDDNLMKADFSNIQEISLAAKIAKDCGCDYFELKPMYDINHYTILQKENLVATLQSEIEKSRGLNDESFRVLLATKMQSILDNSGNIEPKDYTRCAVSQLRTLITPSGVYVCPYFRGDESKKLGDINSSSLLNIWKSQRRSDVLSEVNPSITCKMHCIRHESNLVIEKMISETSGIRTVPDFDMFI